MGWLGWTESHALAADVNSVILALEAKAELLSMCYGDGKKRRKKKKRGKVDSHDFKAFVAQHNRGGAD
jgi:hypothetical protein